MRLKMTGPLGFSRRAFLKVGAAAFAGIDLHRLLATGQGRSEVACIVLFQRGGASQLDTFDPKPEAPRDIRGSFGTVRSSLPGIHLSELMPRAAGMMKKFALIRSMHSEEAIHERARQYVFSGIRPRNELIHPSYGSVIARERGSQGGLPPFVLIPKEQLWAKAGFLGPTYDPFIAGDPNQKNYSVKDLTLPLGLGWEEAQSRFKLMSALDREFKRVEGSSLLDGMDQFYQKAFDLIASPAAKKAFDIGQEPQRLRDTYGRTDVGQGALMARRLVEAGVRLVSVFHNGYDTHTNNDESHRRIVPEFDQAFAALLEDLDQRGMLETTLVLVIGDFGRTPKINFSGGRDHWPGAFSVALAGAGVRGGQVIGKTDARAFGPVDRPVTIEDLGATVYKLLGIDAHKTYLSEGRPIAINKDGKPVKEIWT